MIVCYLGPFDPDLTRNRVIIKGLLQNKVELVLCNTIASKKRVIDWMKVLKYLRSKYDVIMIGARGDYYNQPLVPIVKSLTKTPVVFDSMLTLYETQVVDRQTVGLGSFKANIWQLLDDLALRRADLILSDTEAHLKYYSNFYGESITKFRRVLIGTDDDVFYPREIQKENDDFLVMYWGNYIPLHGIENIVKAAKLLEDHTDIKFELRGSGQMYKSCLTMSKTLGLRNISFNNKWVPAEKLPVCIAKADVTLGNFGNSQKAKRVITCKAVDSIAMGKPLITGDSPAAREVFTHLCNCYLVPMAHPQALANAILELKNNENLRRKIGQNGYRLFKERLSPKIIGRQLKSDLVELVERKR
jgi:glycosyltransferase involved in cell wall biosynthesis